MPEHECEKPQNVVHRCPPIGDGLTPCCGMSPFELPTTDQLTLYPERVTCRGKR